MGKLLVLCSIALASCSTGRLPECEGSTVFETGGLAVQVFDSYRPVSEGANRDLVAAFRPSERVIERAVLSARNEFRPGDIPVWVQSGGFVTIGGDSLVVLNYVYKMPGAYLDPCTMLQGSDGFFIYTRSLSYRLRDASVSEVYY